ncbi:spore germination protein PB [Oikeobacillus pervagus]|uniref:Spore germination protein PB n=1 Tax=Oikeobacillus pervagus TaxID=1325931 RepID=A0AAJ1SXV4_9BACI|nr:spore germination protein GerPB [Oikeobacillus pervagus]MDQ0214789.1 spore germination protein PB [Oikeobacillus pervagus]
MNIYVQQTIQIKLIRIDSISNTGVLQIGTSGSIQSSSHLYNTGGFTKPAPQITSNIVQKDDSNSEVLVPLQIPLI